MLFRAVLSSSLMLFAINGFSSDVDQADVKAARSAVGGFMKSLKGRLTSAMEEAGPVHAVGVCEVDAPMIAAEQSAASGWDVARTSLKVRNPDNAPDAWEKQVLQSFAERHAAGESYAKMERVEVVERDGQQTIRYMKAIPMGEVCTTCHGADIDSELSAKIYELYPDDQARGFEVGELRGAFTLEKPLTE